MSKDQEVGLNVSIDFFLHVSQGRHFPYCFRFNGCTKCVEIYEDLENKKESLKSH